MTEKEPNYTDEEKKILETECTPGARRCMGGTWHQCRAGGSGWFNTTESCDNASETVQTNHTNEEDLPISKEEVDLDNLEISTTEQQLVCGHLEVIETTDRYFKVKATQNGRRFRFVFSKLENNRRIVTSMGSPYTTIAGNFYDATARPGHNSGINCIS